MQRPQEWQLIAQEIVATEISNDENYTPTIYSLTLMKNSKHKSRIHFSPTP